MLANLAASLVKAGRVKTTDAKAKEVRPFIERLVTFAKRGDLHARRIVLARLGDVAAVKKLFDEVGPKFTNRLGGYTRILKLGFRQGDNAPVSLIEFVSDEEAVKAPAKKAPRKTVKKEVPAVQAEVPVKAAAPVEAEAPAETAGEAGASAAEE